LTVIRGIGYKVNIQINNFWTIVAYTICFKSRTPPRLAGTWAPSQWSHDRSLQPFNDQRSYQYY